MENRERVIVVSGASSGIGNASATFLAKKGYKVYGTCRAPGAYSRKADEFFELLAMDITDSASVAKAAEKVLSVEGRIDSLVCCAGSGLVGAIEDSSLEEARAVMEVNFFGTLRTVKAFLPRMREAEQGRILLVGALEGLAATPYQGLFSASECALEGLADALRMEVASFGIEVCVIALGSFRTAFGQNRLVAAASARGSPYKAKLDAALGVLSGDEAAGAEPLVAARAIYAALNARRMPSRLSVGPLQRRLLVLCRPWLPAQLFERLLRKHYRLE